MPPRYSEDQARAAIAASLTYSEALRRLGMRAAGGNFATLRRYAKDIWQIPVDHFQPYRGAVARPGTARPLTEVMVERSRYSRGQLKQRLFNEGVKQRACELCGQGEIWHGRRMALILDHVNGVANDNRLENLRVVCPNCAATLDTHCGRNAAVLGPRKCDRCQTTFRPTRAKQRYCSPACGARHGNRHTGPRPQQRRVQRPGYVQLKREVVELGYRATGRRYGVSDNAIRKWLRQYEAELERLARRA